MHLFRTIVELHQSPPYLDVVSVIRYDWLGCPLKRSVLRVAVRWFASPSSPHVSLNLQFGALCFGLSLHCSARSFSDIYCDIQPVQSTQPNRKWPDRHEQLWHWEQSELYLPEFVQSVYETI